MISVIASMLIASAIVAVCAFGVMRRTRISQPFFARGSSIRCERS